MSDKDFTIHADSPLGKDLKKSPMNEALYLMHDGKKVPVNTVITIGRHKKNNIMIEDDLVSRKHVLIKKIKDEYFIKDLKSTNGTLLNHQPLPPGQFIPLHENDVIKIGSTELTIKHFF